MSEPTQQHEGAPLAVEGRDDDRMELRLEEATANFFALLEASPDPVAIHRGGLIEYVNWAMLVTFGAPSRESLLGRPVLDLVHSDDRSLAEERLRMVEETGQPTPLREGRFVGLDGRQLVGEVHSLAVHRDGVLAVLTIGRDLTEVRRLERQLHHAARLATVGSMAASIAHELNNPLAYVLSNLHDLCERLPLLSEQIPADLLRKLERRVEAASTGAERLQQIARDITGFARSTDEPPASVEPTEVLETALRIASPELRHAEVSTEWSSLPPVRGSALRLTQVLVNLLINAGQAVLDRDVRKVRVAARAEPPGWVTIEVFDSGPGIPPDALQHVFEPFFTTKAIGAGTGLGLSVSDGIVRQLGGTLTAESGGVRLAVGEDAGGARPVGGEDAGDAHAGAGGAGRGAGDEDRGRGGGTILRVRLPVAGPSVSTPDA